MICTVCRGKKYVTLVPLPLVGRSVALCSRCRTAKFIRVMRSLIAHG